MISLAVASPVAARARTARPNGTVLSAEVWAPDSDHRAIPHAPFTDAMAARLEAAGFDHSLRDKPDGWWTT